MGNAQTTLAVSAAEARARGDKFYDPGVPCSRGHTSIRRTSNRTCEACLRESSKRFHKENPDAIKAADARSYAKHRASRMTKMHKYAAENAEQIREQRKQFRAANPEKIRTTRAKHYAQNSTKILAGNAAWIAANPERYKQIQVKGQAKRRGIQLARTPAWFGEFDEFVIEEAAQLAQLRKLSTGVDWHVDHMIPLQARTASGFHCGANLQVIPATMNHRKLNKLIYTNTGDWLK